MIEPGTAVIHPRWGRGVTIEAVNREYRGSTTVMFESKSFPMSCPDVNLTIARQPMADIFHLPLNHFSSIPSLDPADIPGMANHDKRLQAARARAEYELGDGLWAERIIRAYLDPANDYAQLQIVRQSDG